METTQLEKQLSPAQEVQKSLEEKGITQTLINEMKQYEGLTVSAHISEDGHLIVDKNQLKTVSDARKKIKNTRVLIENTAKGFRDVHTQINREYSKKEKEYVDTLSPIEEKLLAEEKKPELLQKQIDEENERKQEDLFKSRVQQLLKFSAQFDGNNYFNPETKVSVVDLKFMSDALFKTTLYKFEIYFAEEQKRIADEKAENEKALAELKKQRDEQEKERIRLESIQKEQEAKQTELKAEQDKIDAQKHDALMQKIEGRRKLIVAINGMVFNGDQFFFAEAEALVTPIDVELLETATDGFFDEVISTASELVSKYRIEQKEKKEAEVKRLAEEKIKRDAEAKAEAERIAKEKEEKRIARQPDKKKLQELAETFGTCLPNLTFKSTEAQEVFKHIQIKVGLVQTFILEEANKL